MNAPLRVESQGSAFAEPPLVPRVVTIGMRPSRPGENWGWHAHPFDELCLFVNGGTTVGHAGKKVAVAPGTAALWLRGEPHGFWNDKEQCPEIWVVHFDVDPAFYRRALALDLRPPEERLRVLTPAQREAFFGLFVKISLESAFTTPNATCMASAWLQLLLASYDRWATEDGEHPSVDPQSGDPELLELWQALSEHVTVPFADMDRLPELIPNYDSLRHRFKRAFGASPRTLLGRMKMQLAQNLLVEGRMSVKEVAHAVGYWRQHEFARAFRRHTGQSPSNGAAGRTKVPLSPPGERGRGEGKGCHG